MAGASISESARERETFRHDPTLLTDFTYDDAGKVIPAFMSSTTMDPILAALTQLGVCRTKALRGFISVFDKAHQYIIAEATQKSSVRPETGDDGKPCESFWFQGTAIPRSSGICGRFLNREMPAEDGHGADLPVNIISDIVTDPDVSHDSCALLKGAARGYVGVPIRSENGIDFGEFSIVMGEPIRAGEWNDADSRALREISQTILEYMVSKASQAERKRSEKKTRGIGTFVEQRSTMMGSRHDPTYSADNGISRTNSITEPGSRTTKRANASHFQTHSSRESRRTPQEGLKYTKNQDTSQSDLPPRIDSDSADNDPLTVVFNNVAHIIRDSIDADGVVFFDAGVGSFNSSGLQFTGSHTHPGASSDGEYWSSDESYAESSGVDNDLHVIASSTSETAAAIDDHGKANHSDVGRMSFKALSALLRRYPRGVIFDVDIDGKLQIAGTSTGQARGASADAAGNMPKLTKRRTLSFIGNLGNEVSKSFPGAQSVAFVPVWDQIKKRWRAGCFAYTLDRARFFTTKGDISYLRAFATLAMAEMANLETHLTSQAQSDVLGSLSHELRSPLHGIIMAVEFLTDTPLSAFQGNLLHILETCGRTLSDTIDHLLYYAKVNNFIPPGKKKKPGAGAADPRAARGLRQEMNYTLQAGMKAITAPVRVDVLLEEVTESVLAGFNFQRMSIGQLERDRRRSHADVYAIRRSDNLQAAEDLSGLLSQVQGAATVAEAAAAAATAPDSPCNHIVVDLAIDPTASHYYYGISGAIRRIMMNLFGNALKYTSTGSIRVALSQAPIRSKKARGHNVRWAKIVVTDTGRGISEDFLLNHLFHEFRQEDPISPGLGLGLSVVKKIVSSLRGRVSIESRVGVGTTATVLLPLQPITRPSLSSSSSSTLTTDAADVLPGVTGLGDDYAEYKKQLRGLRVCVVGFDAPLGLPNHEDRPGDDYQSIRDICRRDLAMKVVNTTQATTLRPDIVLCEEAALPAWFKAKAGLCTSPRVVICANALSAYRLSLESGFRDPTTIIEYISQPTGPRKLAKILMVAIQQWAEWQKRPQSPEKHKGTLTLPLMPPMSCGEKKRSSGTETMSKNNIPALPNPGPFSPLATAASEQRGRYMTRSPSLSPRSNLHIPRPQSQPQPSREVSPPASPPPPPPPRGKQEQEFLLVEDNAINMKILCAYMKKLGRKYSTAEDGQIAVERFRERPPGHYSCVLMDINMPRLDGLQATRQIRDLEAAAAAAAASCHSPPAAAAVIIALTGLASAEVQQEALESGVDVFLIKPARLHEISQILQSRGLT